MKTLIIPEGTWVPADAPDRLRRLISHAIGHGYEPSNDDYDALAAYDRHDDGAFRTTLPNGTVVDAAGHTYWLAGQCDTHMDVHVAPPGQSFGWDAEGNYRLESDSFWLTAEPGREPLGMGD